MKLDYSLNLTQDQKLIMTQAMQLSIRLLQMSTFELKEYIDKEFSENPILEAQYVKSEEEQKIQDRINYKEMIKYLEFDNYGSQNYSSYNEDSDISPFTFISNKKSLKEYLHEQIVDLQNDKYINSICDYLIENIDERGYLPMDIKDICREINVTVAQAEEALSILKSLDPPGIAAKDLKECLKLQLKRKGFYDERIYYIIENHLENLADNKYIVIAREMNIAPQEAQALGDIIKSLEPKPSRGFYTGEDTKYVIPDAYIRNINGEYYIVMNDDVLPKLSVNSMYKEIIKEDKDKEAAEYVKDKLNSAMFLIKGIESRRSTLYKVLEKIIEKQRDYFDRGEDYLKPMTLKDIAQEIDMHESTVSRAIKDKYILTERKTIKIRDLFVTGIQKSMSNEDVATSNIKKKIKELIDEEEKSKPLSDQALCDILNAMQFEISRRTVAKYREELGIKSSSKRKRF
ncbi:RNA polymerase factor sigma-54 [Clostridium polynesiense]|uniref:RNA polymerase factor sigma-54 n=1 Tax=Clostridium polynesiense TaxID=1325933 RepID=UPI0005916848|nr:RNA polymerase factor sigma-54 [Clostridium polynesiense]